MMAVRENLLEDMNRHLVPTTLPEEWPARTPARE